MLFRLFSNFTMEGLFAFLLLIPALLVSLSVHEWAHAFAAYKQGDDFARYSGRMTLNPLKHLDPLGFLCLLVVGFGWAKAVPVVPANFRHGKRSMLIVSLAGIITNLLLSLFVMFLYYFLILVLGVAFSGPIGMAFELFFTYLISINISLAVFNLFPVPPLDGYKVARELFGTWKNRRFFETIERYSSFILIALLVFGTTGNIFSIASGAVYSVFAGLMDIIFMGFM